MRNHRCGSRVRDIAEQSGVTQGLVIPGRAEGANPESITTSIARVTPSVPHRTDRGYGFGTRLHRASRDGGRHGMTAQPYAAFSRTVSGIGIGLLALPSIDSTVMKIMSWSPRLVRS